MPASRVRIGAATLALIAGLMVPGTLLEAQVQPPAPSDQSLHEAMQQLLRTQYLREEAERARRSRAVLAAMRAGLSPANRRTFDALALQLRALGVTAAAARLQPALSAGERAGIVSRAMTYLPQDRAAATDLHFEYLDLESHAGIPPQPAIPPKPDPRQLTEANAALLLFALEAAVAAAHRDDRT